MKVLLCCLLTVCLLRAEDPPVPAALLAADDARISAMKKPDRDALTRLLSAELHSAHSNGKVDTRATLIDNLVTGKARYVGYDHVSRSFTQAAPGIMLMKGQAHVQVESASGKMDSVLSYLAVWRLEEGQWKFHAWQSCKIPPAEPAGK